MKTASMRAIPKGLKAGDYYNPYSRLDCPLCNGRGLINPDDPVAIRFCDCDENPENPSPRPVTETL